MSCQSSNAAAAGGAAPSVTRGSKEEAMRLEIEMAARVRANLLLVGKGAVPVLLEVLEKDLQHEAILSWRPGELLDLPPAGRPATFILHGVHELGASDQHELVRWLEQASGCIRVISTCEEPLWPRVNGGSFDEALYYRLNTVYVDLRATDASQER